MKVAFINGSPKPKESNTKYFLDELKEFIKEDCEILDIDIKNKKALDTKNKEYYEDVYNCDVLVFGYPIYVDSLPSHLLSYMILFEEYLNLKERKDIVVYAIANCGFYEGSHNEISFDILKNWCYRCKIRWGQGVGHGAGEMMGSIRRVPSGHGPKKNLGKALNGLSQNIIKRKESENILISPNFPKIAFRIAGNSFWLKKAKSNNLKRKDINKREK